MRINFRFFSLLFVFLLGFNAEAKFYRCDFTEPFFSVLISTDSKIVTLLGYFEGNSDIKKVASIETSPKLTKIKLKTGELITIRHNQPGSDGMSDFSYPYDVKYQNFYGGCTSEENIKERRLVIERLKSLASTEGNYLVNFWPGEYGHALGYKVTKNFSLDPRDTWADLEKGKISNLKCSLKKSKLFVPKMATRFERYVSFGPSLKVTSQTLEGGEPHSMVLHSYLSEGYCLAEVNGQLTDIDCSRDNIPEMPSQPKDYGVLPEFGNWVFSQCIEGHWTWIPNSTFEKYPEVFEATMVEPF